MALLKDAERKMTADSLKQYKNSATGAIDRLKAIKTQLNELKASVNADVVGTADYYTAADVTDIQSVISWMNTEIGNI